ncbi:hypothetical protein [Tindallia californiensis]|uniref:Uncharacterized protein n=1 Tax=Tindallia californiensis TaxID=159292 RepID=A0A1H3RF26_9FIRM|nr:hypothetical protein [Tindallia californiensis]SDZ24230.1 hypothetical protein SAMN05192546_1205 [Tindallia californiensis]
MYDPYDAKGFSNLQCPTQKIFRVFCVRFWNAWGEKSRKKKQPKEVKLAADENGIFLKVTCADGEWYHVTNTGEWY